MAIGTERYATERYTQNDVTTRDDPRTDNHRASTPPMHSVHQMESGSFAESLAGAAGVVLAILGIIGLLPTVLGAISAIAVGIGLFLGGGVIAARSKQLDVGLSNQNERRQILGGLGMEALAGASGAVLGLLSLLGIAPVTLLSVSAIVLGGALLMASAATARLESALGRMAESGDRHKTAHEAVYVASGSDFLVGAGAVILGILALAGHAPITLALVAMLSVGAAGMLSGSTFAARVFTMFGA